MVKREAKYEGLQDNSVTVALVNWALPYAQRYIFTLHHEKYTQTKKTVHTQVKRLQVSVVEKLCYRNVIPQYGISSKKEFKCNSLLQVRLLCNNISNIFWDWRGCNSSVSMQVDLCFYHNLLTGTLVL